MSVSRCCRVSCDTSSWLIFNFTLPLSSNTCTTTARSVWVSGWCGGGGCGTSASSPFGVSGVMTMKMISSTSKTSIKGVTLISAVCPPPPPVVIAIELILFCLVLVIAPTEACSRRAVVQSADPPGQRQRSGHRPPLPPLLCTWLARQPSQTPACSCGWTRGPLLFALTLPVLPSAYQEKPDRLS